MIAHFKEKNVYKQNIMINLFNNSGKYLKILKKLPFIIDYSGLLSV